MAATFMDQPISKIRRLVLVPVLPLLLLPLHWGDCFSTCSIKGEGNGYQCLHTATSHALPQIQNIITDEQCVHHLPYWFHMGVVLKSLDQRFHPGSGYAVICQPFYGGITGWGPFSTRHCSATYIHLMQMSNTLMGISTTCVCCLPKLLQWCAVSDDSCQSTSSHTPHTITYKAAITEYRVIILFKSRTTKYMCWCCNISITQEEAHIVIHHTVKFQLLCHYSKQVLPEPQQSFAVL